MRQLALPFDAAPEYAAADFIDAPGNAEARAWLARTATWPTGRLALWGEGGVGKSHLVHLWARERGARVLAGAGVGRASEDGVAGGVAGAAGRGIAIDDADLLGEEEAFLHLLNRAAEARVAVLIAGRVPPARFRVGLADLASRLAATPAVRVGAPDEGLRGVLFQKLLSARQLVIEPALAQWLLARLPREAGALGEAAARLDRAGLAAGRAVTRRLAVAALAPLLAEGDDDELAAGSREAGRLL